MSERAAYPLAWPLGWPRTPTEKRKAGTFKATPAAAVNALISEIDLLVVRRRGYTIRHSVILSTNSPLLSDGKPSSHQMTLVMPDPGVAVYFPRDNKEFCLACDTFDRIWKNIWALKLTIEAMRGIDRWGSSTLLDRAFQGFAALPAPGQSHAETWYQVLGVSPDADIDQVNAAYREKAKLLHPDVGGGNDEIYRLNDARDQAVAALDGGQR